MEKGKCLGTISTEKFGSVKFYQTTNYDLFGLLNSNRDVQKSHVLKLYNSIQEKLLFTVIFVNEYFEVIDGQHRLKAFQKANVPVIYAIIRGYNNGEIVRYNNSNRNWAMIDYIDHFIAKDFRDYVVYKNVQAKYKFPSNILINLLSGKKSGHSNMALINNFKKGKFYISDMNFTVKVGELVNELLFIENASTVPFYSAIIEILKYNENIDIDRLIKSCKDNNHKLINMGSSVEFYLRSLEKVYNHHKREDNKTMIYNHIKFN